MKIFFTSCLFLFITYSISIAQDEGYAPGYWITSDGDTVSGFVNEKISKGKFIKLKRSRDEKPIQKSASEISKIFQNDVLTISSYSILNSGKKEDIFLELLSLGEDNGLFKGKHPLMGNIFAVYKNEQFFVLNKNDLVSSYSFLYGDCPSFDLDIKYAFTQKSIKGSFEQYNLCMEKDMPQETNPRMKKKSEIYVGPKLGYTFGNFKHLQNAYFKNGDYSTISSPKIGVVGQIAISRKFNFQTDLSYVKKKSSSDSVNTPPLYIDPDIYSNFVEYDLSFIDWQFYVNYIMIKKTNFSAMIGLGLNYGFLIDSNFTQEANGYGLGGNGPPFVDFSSSYEVGLLASIGAIYYTNRTNQIQLNLKFNITEMYYFVHRNPGDIAEYGAGSNSFNSTMTEISINYLFKVQ